MPQYIMPGAADPRFRALDTFTQAYITAALFTEANDEVGFTDLHPDTIASMTADCAAFQQRADLAGDAILDQAGHDFWLTRNGHGSGFWDGDWPEPGATRLTDLARTFSQVDLYIGDDGRVYA